MSEVNWLKCQISILQSTINRQGILIASLRNIRNDYLLREAVLDKQRNESVINLRVVEQRGLLIEKLQRRIHALKTAVKVARRLDLANARKSIREWHECAVVLYELVEPEKLDQLTEHQKNKLAIVRRMLEIPF